MAGAVELLLPCGGQIRFTFNGLYKPEVVQHQHFHKVSLNEYRVRINVDCKPPRARGVANRTPFCVGWNSIQEDGGEQRPKNSEEHDDPFTGSPIVEGYEPSDKRYARQLCPTPTSSDQPADSI